MVEKAKQKISFFKWLKSSSFMTQFSMLLVVCAIIAGLATYASLTGSAPFISSDPETTYVLLNIDLVILLLLSALIARRIFILWRKRKEKSSGTKLQWKLISTFSLFAIVPAVLMAFFSAAFFYFAVQSWFSDRVSTAVNESLAVAEAYLQEHQKVIRADVLAMANDLNRDFFALTANSQLFDTVVQKQTFVRNFSEVLIFDDRGRIISRAGLNFAIEFDVVPLSELERTKQGEIILLIDDKEDRVSAITHLQNYGNLFLYVGRRIEAGILDHVDTAVSAVNEYKRLEERKTDFIFSITLIFTSVTLLVVLGAVLLGLLFAKKLTEPLLNLLKATERIRGGDFNVQISEKNANDETDELEVLIKAFNKMTKQIEIHRTDLIDANRQIANRNYFIEAVFSGVTSGIIGVDKDREISIVNKSTLSVLNKTEKDILNKKLKIIFPQFFETLNRAVEKDDNIYQEEISFENAKGQNISLLVRVALERNDEDQLAIITFDDISNLIAAQRKAAWAGVAKRIAHEIKNPLTPIQLSAERLKRKYQEEISSDKETFIACTDTIIRQVEEIGRMVNEFSEFARMPEPVLRNMNILKTIESAFLFHKQAYPEIKFNLDLKSYTEAEVLCDQGLITQALNNLIKNAIEATEEQSRKEENPDFTPEVSIRIETKEKKLQVYVEDNGGGFPANALDKAMEPYVTTKEKGTGLGLAIVKKIMEDHNGTLKIENRISHNCVIGATAVLTMPLILLHKQQVA